MAERESGEVTRLEVRRVFDAPRADVFEAWTDPALMQQWFAPGPMTTPEVQVDLRVGGGYRVCMQHPDGSRNVASGTYVEIVPGERLVFTWGWDGPERRDTLVTVELRALGERTEVVLVHERFETRDAREQHLQGWHGCLDKLGAFLGRRTPQYPPQGAKP